MPYNLTSCGLVSVCNLFVNSGTSTDENVAGVYIQNNFSGANGFGLVVSRNGSGTTAAISIGSDSSNNGIISANNTDLIFGKNTSGTFNQYMRINTSGNVGIGTTTPCSKLHIASGPNTDGLFVSKIAACTNKQGIFISADDSAGAYIAGGTSPDGTALQTDGFGRIILQNGTAEGLQFQTSTVTAGSAQSWTTRMVIKQSGNVGIGTTSPCSTLEVGNTSTLYPTTIIRSQPGYLPALMLARGDGTFSSTPNSNWMISNSDNGFEISKTNCLNPSVAVRTQYLVIGATGNVGINTTSPSTKLHVCNPVNQAYSPTSFNSSLHALHIQFCDQDQRAGLIRWTSHGNLENTFGVVQIGCSTGGTGCGQGDFVFQAYRDPAAYSELMRLTRLGNVGIGCSLPGAKLTVAGTVTATDTITTTSGTVSNYLTYTSTTGVIGTQTNHALQLRTNDTERVRIDTSGNVGIGTTSPQNYAGYVSVTIGDNDVNKKGLLKFRGCFNSGGGAEIYQASDGVLSFSMTGASIAMGINCSNNVGIGTITPSYKLHVNGTFYAAGSSIKYKEGICNYDTDSCLFMCLKPVTYQYKDEWQHLGRELKSQSQIGLIAEDVAEVMPELAVLVNEEDEKVVRNVDYEKLSVVLLKEVQKLRLEVDQLKNNK